MYKIYLSDEVIEGLIEKEIHLGCLYKIGSVEKYVYFFEINSGINLYKVHVDTILYEDMNDIAIEVEMNELVHLFEENLNRYAYPYYQNNEFDIQPYDYSRLVLDGNTIIGYQ